MKKMQSDDIDNFLKRRSPGLTLIETAVMQYREVGKIFSSKHAENFNKKNIDNFNFGCVTQFFAFLQKITVDCIFTQFITIIGGCTKNGVLKAWERIPFVSDAEENRIKTILKEIRGRYAEARNNLICHINDSGIVLPKISIPTVQIIEDAAVLRKIFNDIRAANQIPIEVAGYQPLESYSVVGLKSLMELVFNFEAKKEYI